jgi:hypothetical protein
LKSREEREDNLFGFFSFQIWHLHGRKSCCMYERVRQSETHIYPTESNEPLKRLKMQVPVRGEVKVICSVFSI